MTREKNIRAILECNFAGFKDDIIDIAVKRICEIEQEPKTDGDCISREKTLEKFCDYVGSGMSMDDFDALYDIVSKMPSVQPKTGHWKRISMDKYTTHAQYWYRCDRCGKDNLGNTDWCPNCGADMRGEQHG